MKRKSKLTIAIAAAVLAVGGGPPFARKTNIR